MLCQNQQKYLPYCMNNIPIPPLLRQSRYKIVKALGSGGYGETYLAEYPYNVPVPTRFKCVVKRLKFDKKYKPDIVRQFQKEAATLHTLGDSHHQIPTLIDYFEENLDFYLIQEYIEGHDLSNEIVEGKPWSEADIIQLLQEVLEVLAFVHQQGVIHRDIKPSNIMRPYSDRKLILIDFGIAKEVRTQIMNIQGQMTSSTSSGTLGYMPSEQLSGHPNKSSDVYALGLTAIQALTGVLPQQLPKDPKTLEFIWRDRAQVSDTLAHIVAQMVRYHFSQRYPSAAEVLQALKDLILLPQYVNKNDVAKLKMEALLAEKIGDYEKANQLWIRLKSITSDSDRDILLALKRLERLPKKPENAPLLTTPPFPTPTQAPPGIANKKQIPVDFIPIFLNDLYPIRQATIKPAEDDFVEITGVLDNLVWIKIELPIDFRLSICVRSEDPNSQFILGLGNGKSWEPNCHFVMTPEWNAFKTADEYYFEPEDFTDSYLIQPFVDFFVNFQRSDGNIKITLDSNYKHYNLFSIGSNENQDFHKYDYLFITSNQSIESSFNQTGRVLVKFRDGGIRRLEYNNS
jgi:serine/threonine protein kinase